MLWLQFVDWTAVCRCKLLAIVHTALNLNAMPLALYSTDGFRVAPRASASVCCVRSAHDAILVAVESFGLAGCLLLICSRCRCPS